MNIGLRSILRDGVKQLSVVDLFTGGRIENIKAWIWGTKDMLISTGMLAEDHFSEQDATDDYLIIVVPCRYAVEEKYWTNKFEELKMEHGND